MEPNITGNRKFAAIIITTLILEIQSSKVALNYGVSFKQVGKIEIMVNSYIQKRILF